MTRPLHLIFRRMFISLVVAVQMASPVAVFAQETTPTDVPPEDSTSQSTSPEGTTDTPPAADQAPASDPVEPIPPADPQPTAPAASQTGPQAPTGSDSTTYVFNAQTGLWENDYYTWDPVTKLTKPKGQIDYSYNPTTGMWDTTQWYYSPESGKYLPNVVSTAQAPVGAAAAAYGISNTGPNSNNQIAQNGNSQSNFNLFFNSAISNKIGQMSTSGNAAVQGNTLGGSALTGDATAVANLLNMIQSSWGQLGSEDISTFMANIDGDVVGDLYVDPNQIGQGAGNQDINLKVTSDSAIHNDIDVGVASGDATVSGNTKAGDATSGSANAVVNLLNLINSAIRANKSFVGVLNINGNLNGDILLPPEMMQAIIAATGPNSNNQIDSNHNKSLTANINDTKTINNDITTNVGSGSATVSGNTTGGDATTGAASSNVVLLNLTGKKVVAKNALLVFVNVLGNWVGLIYDAPAGTNSAIATTGPGSNNTITDNGNLTVDTDVDTRSLIDNDVTVAAHSGDATVSNNTSGGNATSGNASAGVNALNLIDSEFDVSDWFGVLFINVFGSWIGSFGVDTSAGNTPAGVAVTSGSNESTSTASTTTNKQTFAFVSRAISSENGESNIPAAAEVTDTSGNSSNQTAAVLGTSDNGPTLTATQASSGPWLVAAIATFAGALMLGGERLLALMRQRTIA